MFISAWIFVIIALIGTFLNANQDKRGFYFWIVSNIAFMVIELDAASFATAFLFFVYTSLSVYGLIKWK